MSIVTQLTTVPADLIGAPSSPTPPAKAPAKPSPPATSDADSSTTEKAADPEQRLVIQENGETGSFIYTVIDRTSGKVVAETTREEVARMSERADYAAGSLIKTRA